MLYFWGRFFPKKIIFVFSLILGPLGGGFWLKQLEILFSILPTS